MYKQLGRISSLAMGLLAVTAVLVMFPTIIALSVMLFLLAGAATLINYSLRHPLIPVSLSPTVSVMVRMWLAAIADRIPPSIGRVEVVPNKD